MNTKTKTPVAKDIANNKVVRKTTGIKGAAREAAKSNVRRKNDVGFSTISTEGLDKVPSGFEKTPFPYKKLFIKESKLRKKV